MLLRNLREIQCFTFKIIIICNVSVAFALNVIHAATANMSL